MPHATPTWDSTGLTDTHCHVDQLSPKTWPGFYDRATQAGVKNFVWVSTDQASYEKTKIMVGPAQSWAISLGTHPHEAKQYDPEVWETLFSTQPYVAVGECGLDYHYDFSPRDAQRVAFEHQLTMALKHHKPVIVHVREAFEDATLCIERVSKQGVRGVVHCFTGNKAQVKKIIDAGWYVGFTGVITFQAKVADIIEALRYAPINRLLLETDSPYLAPHPHRGKPNEPSFLPLVAQKVAEIKGLPLEDVILFTTGNANRLFLGK